MVEIDKNNMLTLKCDLFSNLIWPTVNFNPYVTPQMARKMKVTGTELSEEEIENMLEQGRFVHSL